MARTITSHGASSPALARIVRGMQIRAVVTDVDGTIAREDGLVSAATLRASRALTAVGVPLVAATARTPIGLVALQPLSPPSPGLDT